MQKTKRRKRKAVAELATVTFTREEAMALLSGIGVALRLGQEPPESVAPHLASAIDKLDVAFGFQLGGE